MSRQDLSATPNLFAARLSAALERRGLSLHRIQARLAETDLKISTATLSYWASGRSCPTRNRSLDVVRTLEQLLQVEAGHLVDALPSERHGRRLSTMMPEDYALPDDVERELVERSRNWHRLLVHDSTTLGPPGTARTSHTRMVSRAEVDGLDSWTVVVSAAAGCTPAIEPLSGAELGRVVSRPELGLLSAELVLPRPLRRGECAVTEYRRTFDAEEEPLDRFGRALPRPTDLLVLEVAFTGARPRNVERCFIDDEGEHVMDERSLLVTPDSAQCTVTGAAPGTHHLRWSW